MYVSIDLGSTNTRVASSKDFEELHKVEKFATNKNIEEQREILSETILRVADKQVDQIVLGVPGMIDKDAKRFVKFSNYHELDGLLFSELFTPELRYPELTVENDAALAGLGESVVGIGRNYSSVAYFTLSTGIGGAMIVDKKISEDEEHQEPGHFVVNEKSEKVDGLGIKGSFEAFSSGIAFAREYGMTPEECEDEDTWKQYGYFLGTGLISVIRRWWPDVVILGGGISNKFLLFFPGVMERFAKEGNYEIPPILKSELMDDAGLRGGFVYLKQKVQGV